MSWSYEYGEWTPFLIFWERRLVVRRWRNSYWDEKYEYRWREE